LSAGRSSKVKAVEVTVHTFIASLLVSMGTGLSLGLLTVTLTANLRALLHLNSWELGIGMGTELA